MYQDSREISMTERADVANRVAESLRRRVLLTVGTYLMPDIAREVTNHAMAQYFKEHGKKVVLTGSLKPLTGYLESDAGFNMGMSVAVLHHETRSGIFIVMNGSCFFAETVRKDPNAAKFHGSDGSDAFNFDGFDLVTAGGTMDFEFDGLDGLRPAGSSFVPRYLRDEVRINRPFSALSPFVKDSRDLTNPDLDLVAKMVRESKRKEVLVTMGAYKLDEMRQHLMDVLGDEAGGKRVMITGSRLPLGLSDRTDAPFQLGYALGAMNYVDPGVHIAVNGQVLGDEDNSVHIVFTPDEISTLVERGIIEPAA
jgi:L-asparaginase